MSTFTVDEAVAPRARRRSSRRNPVAPYLFLAPGMILFALCILYPMVRSGQMSFYDWNIVKGSNSDFVGLDNYVKAFHDPSFWTGLGNSGIYMLLTVPPQIVLGLAVAMLLRSKAPLQPLFRVLYYLPVVTSWVV
ncbi:MAG: carbohydrate ABC transporter permease, partial [Pauljensenia sp.]